MTFGPCFTVSSTVKRSLARQHKATPPCCFDAAFVATTSYPRPLRAYIPPVSLVSVRNAKSTSSDSSALSALSNPPFRPLLMFQVATEKVPLPSARDGATSASPTMPTSRGVPRRRQTADLRLWLLPDARAATGRTGTTSSSHGDEGGRCKQSGHPNRVIV